ncbi:ATP-binding protein [Pontiellaceae bacterium B12219]|nr:ATP-binding protein [Pontiellaceae bacterium B12219]
MRLNLLIPAIVLSCIVSVSAQTVAPASYSDPCFPDELKPSASGMSRRSLRALTKLEQELREELARFPPLESRIAPPHQQFGFLSGRHPVSATNESMQAWVQLAFFGNWTMEVDGIALVPAYYPMLSADGNYGFPKRFKIEVFSHGNPDLAVTVVDWTKEDFPDPGLHPVIFSFPPQDVQIVRLTVTKGVQDGGSQFFALDELMVFQSGNNVAPPSYQGLTASDSTQEVPYWYLPYLTNRKIHVGSFFHTYQPVTDFIQYFDPDTLQENHPEIRIDMGRVRSVGRVELYPAKVSGVPIPEFSFPLKYTAELKRDLSADPVAVNVVESNPLGSGMRWHPFSSARGRFLKLTFDELPLHNGSPVLALGEIRIVGRKGRSQVNFAEGASIRLSPTPEGDASDGSLLTDGFSNGREIMQERYYIEQMAERKIVSAALADVEQRLLIARATRKQTLWTLGVVGGLIILSVLVFWIMYQRIVRQRALYQLRKQIAADLHDDISANLGTISMITTRLQQTEDPSLLRRKLAEISHITQESFLSVKEIIWHMDSEVVYFAELFEKIQKMAMLILNDTHISTDFKKDCKAVEVPARIRRNMMLLVKEALYNCAKYAHAKNMEIQADIRDYVLVPSMKDDGCGFDADSPRTAKSDSGRGLANMQRRAHLLGGELDIQSEPGRGTLLTLRMPLK